MSKRNIQEVWSHSVTLQAEHYVIRGGILQSEVGGISEEHRGAFESNRRFLRVGAVFLGAEEIVKRTPKRGHRRILIVGGAVPENEIAEIGLTRNVQVVSRISWKPHLEERYGTPTQDVLTWAEKMATGKPHWLYTPAGLLPRFDKAGFFELELRRPYPVSELIRCPFLGWLPLPYVTWARVRSGASLDEPYPPEAS